MADDLTPIDPDNLPDPESLPIDPEHPLDDGEPWGDPSVPPEVL